MVNTDSPAWRGPCNGQGMRSDWRGVGDRRSAALIALYISPESAQMTRQTLLGGCAYEAQLQKDRGA